MPGHDGLLAVGRDDYCVSPRQASRATQKLFLDVSRAGNRCVRSGDSVSARDACGYCDSNIDKLPTDSALVIW
jgi:hypothetical protein